MSLIHLMRVLLVPLALLGLCSCEETLGELTGGAPIGVQTRQLASFDPTRYLSVAVIVSVDPDLGPSHYGAPMGRGTLVRAVTEATEKELGKAGYPVAYGKTLPEVLAHVDDVTPIDGTAVAKRLGSDLLVIVHVHELFESVSFLPDGLSLYAQRYGLTAEAVDVATATVGWVAVARGQTQYNGGHLVQLAVLTARTIADLFPPKTLDLDHLSR
jgi:hypothetical protein